MTDAGPLEGVALTNAISAAMVALYGHVYGHDIAVEHLTGRRVVAFLSANQTCPGVASELLLPRT